MGSNTVATIDGDSKFNAIFSKYLNSSDSDISKFVESIPSKFEDAIKALNAEPATIDNEFVRSNRNNLKAVVTRFHNKAGTLDEKIKDQIDALDNEKLKIIVGIHQPNLFAFSGVFKKIVLLQELANHIKKTDSTIVPLFLIVDHDFMDDKWMHIAKLPNIRSSSGVLDLRYPINESTRWKISSKTEPPTRSLIRDWEDQIYNWIKNSKNLSKHEVKSLYSKYKEFWNIVEESISIADTYSEFNSIIMSKIANTIWGYNILFVNLSDMSTVFKRGYNYLLSENDTYLESLDKSETFFRARGIYTGVSANLNKHSPLWLHCDCGSKASSKIRYDDNNGATLIGKCISCKKNLSLFIGKKDNASIQEEKLCTVSPRAIPILLLLSRELSIAGYISGTGGSIGYTLVGKKVFDDLNVKLPTMVLWAGSDIYTGFAQKEASDYLSDNNITNIPNFVIEIDKKYNDLRNKIEPLISKRNMVYNDKEQLETMLGELFMYKQEQRKIKELQRNVQKSRNALKLKPCIIDYAVNLGIKQIEYEWSNKLVINNDLTKPVVIN
ncbi:MAG TPA: bacillithiol biosynthesis BshC [Candidatus Nitrosocosmicus sp.]|nr:bacillithiol biosynthesis BshC [Candidatus Nitrosocosmicus sp.]